MSQSKKNEGWMGWILLIQAFGGERFLMCLFRLGRFKLYRCRPVELPLPSGKATAAVR